MSEASRLAVEITKGDDFLNIWVDANNNGVRDDDDVNIFVSPCGNVFTQSPTFAHSVNTHIETRLKEAAVALMQAGHDHVKEEQVCELALELVLDAIKPLETEQTAFAAEPAPAAPTSIAVATADNWQTQPAPAWHTQAPLIEETTAPAAETNEFGVPLFRPQ